ncbi:MAG: TetR/AcrR family transcriptional regulator [Solirubrobacteraceae bacterium]
MPYRRTARTDERLAASRERILLAAQELIAGGGYRAATIAAVAARAGLATGSVYRHFRSKAELFAEVFRRVSQGEVDACAAAAQASAGKAGERVAAGARSFSERAMRAPRLAWALLAEPVDPAVEAERLVFRRAFRDTFAQLIAAGVQAGELPPQDAALSAALLVGALGEALVGPLAGEAEPAVDELCHFCIRAITNREYAHAEP